MNFMNRYSNLSAGFNRRPKSRPKVVDNENANFLRDLNLQHTNSQKIQIPKIRRQQQNTTAIMNNKPTSVVVNRNNWVFSDIFLAPTKNSEQETIVDRRRTILGDQLGKFMARQVIADSTTAPTATNPCLGVTKQCPKNERNFGYSNFEGSAVINDYVSQKIWPVEEPVVEVARQRENRASVNSRGENETLQQKLSGLEQQTVKLYTAKRNFNEKLKQVVVDYEKQIEKLKKDLDFESQANRKSFLECVTLRKDLSEKGKEIESLTQKLYDCRESAEAQVSKLKDDIRELENRCQTAENKYAQSRYHSGGCVFQGRSHQGPIRNSQCLSRSSKCALQSCSLVQSKENHKLVSSKKDYKLLNSKEKMIKIIVPADYTIPGYIWCQTTSMIRPIKLKLWYNSMALYCKQCMKDGHLKKDHNVADDNLPHPLPNFNCYSNVVSSG
uniref:CCHC-type domain-containing protein n=1 Tax=Romanomermis culicivorax TaxID=13658 RepID=A0A915KF25_ROMCU